MRGNKIFMSGYFLVIFIVFLGSALAYTITLQPGPVEGKDAWISSANESYGNLTYLAIGKYWTGARQEYWTFIEFNYSQFMGNLTNATNISSKLQMYYYYGSGLNNHSIYRSNASWGENSINWMNKPGVGEYYSTQTLVGGSWYEWDVTQHILGVKNGNITNYGFILKNPSATNYNRFYSSDYLTNTTLRPKLVVEYD